MGITSSKEAEWIAQEVRDIRKTHHSVKPAKLPQPEFPHPPTAICKAIRCPMDECREQHELYYAKIGRDYHAPSQWSYITHQLMGVCDPTCPLAETLRKPGKCLVCGSGLIRRLVVHSRACQERVDALHGMVECACRSSVETKRHIDEKTTLPLTCRCLSNPELLPLKTATHTQTTTPRVKPPTAASDSQPRLGDDEMDPVLFHDDGDSDKDGARFSDDETTVDDLNDNIDEGDADIDYNAGGGGGDAADDVSTICIAEAEYEPLPPDKNEEDETSTGDGLAYVGYMPESRYQTQNERGKRLCVEHSFMSDTHATDETSWLLAHFRSEFMRAHQKFTNRDSATYSYVAAVADGIIERYTTVLEPQIDLLFKSFAASNQACAFKQPTAGVEEAPALFVEIPYTSESRRAVNHFIRMNWVLYTLKKLETGTRCGSIYESKISSGVNNFITFTPEDFASATVGSGGNGSKTSRKGKAAAADDESTGSDYSARLRHYWMVMFFPTIVAMVRFHLGMYIPDERLLGQLFAMCPIPCIDVGRQSDTVKQKEQIFHEHTETLKRLEQELHSTTAAITENKNMMPQLAQLWSTYKGIGPGAVQTTVNTVQKRLSDLAAKQKKIISDMKQTKEQIAEVGLDAKDYKKTAIKALADEAEHFIENVVQFTRKHKQARRYGEHLGASKKLDGKQRMSQDIIERSMKWFHRAVAESITRLTLDNKQQQVVRESEEKTRPAVETLIPIHRIHRPFEALTAIEMIEATASPSRPNLDSLGLLSRRRIPRLPPSATPSPSLLSPTKTDQKAAAANSAALYHVPFETYKMEHRRAWDTYYRTFITDTLNALFASPYWKQKMNVENVFRYTIAGAVAVRAAFRLLEECSQYIILPHNGQQLYVMTALESVRQITEAVRDRKTDSAMSAIRTACPFAALDAERTTSMCSVFTLGVTTAGNFKITTDLYFAISMAIVLGQTVEPIVTFAKLYGQQIRNVASFTNTALYLKRSKQLLKSANDLTEFVLFDCATTFNAWIDTKPKNQPSLNYCPTIAQVKKWINSGRTSFTARELMVLFISLPKLCDVLSRAVRRIPLAGWDETNTKNQTVLINGLYRHALRAARQSNFDEF